MKKSDQQPANKFENLQKRVEEVRAKAQADNARKAIKKEDKTPSNEKQLDLFPNAEAVIRTELNTAKFANFIFISPRSEKVSEMRTFHYKDGEKEVSLYIHPASYVTPNTKQQEHKGPTITSSHYWYAFLQIWESRGCPCDGKIVTSGVEIFKILNIKAGKSSYQRLYRELQILEGSSLEWDFSFINKKDGKVYEGSKRNSFLADYHYVNAKNRQTDDIFAQSISIHLNPDMVDNLVAGIRKPIRFKEYLSIASYDASRLYNMLDIFLSGKPKWERNSVGLFEDLDITGVVFKKRKERRRKLNELITTLDKKRISNGLLQLSIREGKADLVLVARKIPVKEVRTLPTVSINDAETIQYLVEDMAQHVPFSLAKQENGGTNLITRYAMTYPREVIHNALSRYKSDAKYDKSVRNKKAMFTTYLHREVHLAKLMWVGKCDGINCHHMPDLIDRVSNKKTD